MLKSYRPIKQGYFFYLNSLGAKSLGEATRNTKLANRVDDLNMIKMVCNKL